MIDLLKVLKIPSFLFAFIFASGTAHSSDYSQNTFNNMENSAYGHFGFAEGGLTIGGEYEHHQTRTFGIGGFARHYSKDDDRASGFGLFSFGGFIRPHFHRQAWDFYLSPGFGIMMLDTGADDETLLGPIFQIGLLYQFSRQVSFGVENTRHYVWFDDDYSGALKDDFVAKFRYSF